MFEKELGKLGRLHKVKAIGKPLPLNKNNQAKQNKNKKMIKTAQTTNKSNPPVRKGFDVKKHSEHGPLRTILIQHLIS